MAASDALQRKREQSADDYAARPDPSEPWRYGCPECGSFQVRAIGGPSDAFECQECWSRTRRNGLVDRTAE